MTPQRRMGRDALRMKKTEPRKGEIIRFVRVRKRERERESESESSDRTADNVRFTICANQKTSKPGRRFILPA